MNLPALANTVTPNVFIHDGKAVTTSQAVAEYFIKRHDNVIQKLKSLDCSPEFNALNFKAVDYCDAKGEKRPMYEMTKDGFVFLVMGFTGKKAAAFKEAYIAEFNRMEAELSLNDHSRGKRSASVDASALLSKLDSANAMLKMVCDDVKKFDPNMADRIQSSMTFLTFYAMTLRSRKVTHRGEQLPAVRHH